MEGRGNVFPNPYWKLCLCLIPPSSLDLNNSFFFFFSHWPFPIAAHPSSEHLAFGISHRKTHFSSSPSSFGMFSRASLSGFPQISHFPLCCFLLSLHSQGYHLFSLREGVFLLHIHADFHVVVGFKSFSFTPALTPSFADKDKPCALFSAHQAAATKTPNTWFFLLPFFFLLQTFSPGEEPVP